MSMGVTTTRPPMSNNRPVVKPTQNAVVIAPTKAPVQAQGAIGTAGGIFGSISAIVASSLVGAGTAFIATRNPLSALWGLLGGAAAGGVIGWMTGKGLGNKADSAVSGVGAMIKGLLMKAFGKGE